MERTIFTEKNVHTIIGIWYKHDETFQCVARGQVRAHLNKGLELDGDFLSYLTRLADDGWCKNRDEA